jgi:ankyrin repeat protein
MRNPYCVAARPCEPATRGPRGRALAARACACGLLLGLAAVCLGDGYEPWLLDDTGKSFDLSHVEHWIEARHGSPDTTNVRGYTLLQLTMRGTPRPFEPEADAIASYLLEHGADPDIPFPDEEPRLHTMLHEAARLGMVDLVRALVDHHAHVNAIDGSGYTPLLYAAYCSTGDNATLAIVQNLLDHGADVRQKSSDGHSALDILGDWGQVYCWRTYTLLKAKLEAAR